MTALLSMPCRHRMSIGGRATQQPFQQAGIAAARYVRTSSPEVWQCCLEVSACRPLAAVHDTHRKIR
jgi:hypothetical protein